jgi:signal transduction histidine kinase
VSHPVLFVGLPEFASAVRSQIDCNIIKRNSVNDALAVLSASNDEFDCVITDHNSQTIDSTRLLDRVSDQTSVIVVPTNGSSSLATAVYAKGAAGYIDRNTSDTATDILVNTIKKHTAEETASNSSLAEENKRLEEFVSFVSHELNNPIQKSKSGLDLIAAECDSKYIDEVDETLDRMEELVDDLLSVAKYGYNSPDVTDIDLREVIVDSWPESTTAAIDVESSLPIIKAEESLVKQIFENLFRNAIEHGGPNIQVRVGVLDPPATDASDSVSIYIADNGPGIDPEARSKIFEFGHTDSRDGTGLGLAIVDRIVETFGWQITVTESRDGGARFELHGIPTVSNQ